MKKRDFIKRILNIVPAVIIGRKLDSHQDLADKLMKETKEAKQIRDREFTNNASGTTRFYNVSG